MWHEARRQEKKLRGMLVDYRKRAERRRDFYEKIKADPTQFLQLHGRPCKIHLDAAVAQAADSPATMMPWQGQADNLIDRFDVRAHLDYIPPVLSAQTNGDSYEERQCNYERYRILAQNIFLSVNEEKFLKQLHLEEQFGYTASKNDEKKSKTGVAIGFNYDEPGKENLLIKTDLVKAESDSSDSDSDLDVDLCIDMSKIEQSQAHELNRCGQQFGMCSNDFYSFLINDMEEAENIRIAREEEHEKALYSGRKSRRERRAHRERRLANRIPSPPSYAARASPTYPAFRESKSISKSPSPENTGQITYITSFGGEDDLPSTSRPTYADKVKYGKKSTTRKSLSRSPKRERKRERSNSRNRSPRRYKRSRSPYSKRRSSSLDRFRNSPRRHRFRSRFSPRRRSHRRSRSRSRSRSKYFSSKKRLTKSTSSSSSPSPIIKKSKKNIGTKKYRNSRSRSRSRSRIRSKNYRSYRSSSSMSKKSSSSSKSKSSRSRSVEEVKVSPKRAESPRPVQRYYGRKQEDKSSSELSDLDDGNKSLESNPVSSSEKSSSVFGNSGSTSKVASAAKLTPQERLKKKMQILLNKQYKADKIAEQIRTERAQQEQRNREDELREMALKLRRKQRERRHAYDENSSCSNSSSSDESSKPSNNDNDKRSTTPELSPQRKRKDEQDNRSKSPSPKRKQRIEKSKNEDKYHRSKNNDSPKMPSELNRKNRDDEKKLINNKSLVDY